ncbi:DNA glycosylase [Xylogone sp. PMI_703]|nr:DNA glycosylase [Xylogone sp. PMI_703]
MRTSRVSKETAKLINATSAPSTRRTTRSTLARFAHGSAALPKDEERQDSTDIEDVLDNPLKRKRSTTPRSPAKKKTVTIKREAVDSVNFSPPSTKDRKVRKPARQVKNEETGEVEIHPPKDWEEVYNVVMEMRTNGAAKNAVVDTMGCDKLGQRTLGPEIRRFQTLIALMLSSQTKDTVNAATMKRLQTEVPPHKEGAEPGLYLENILAIDPKLLNELIWQVGFHNNKTKYIKQAVEILRDKWNGDIPDTIEGMMSLPGVGPKMAYLCMSSAWGRTEGIGVDVHVHRITNLWGWHKTKTPEETRMALQAWLPKEKWHEINWLLVGLGQSICLPVGRKCGECELGLQGLCKSAERSKVIAGRKIKEEMIKKDEEGNVVAKTETVEIKQEVGEVPVNVKVEEAEEPENTAA